MLNVLGERVYVFQRTGNREYTYIVYSYIRTYAYSLDGSKPTLAATTTSIKQRSDCNKQHISLALALSILVHFVAVVSKQQLQIYSFTNLNLTKH